MDHETRAGGFEETRLGRFLSCERGATAVEYSIIAGMVAVALVVIMTGVTESMMQLPFGEIGDALRGDGTPPPVGE